MANLASSPRHSDSWHGAQLAAAELPTGVVSPQPPGGSIADGNTVRAVISLISLMSSWLHMLPIQRRNVASRYLSKGQEVHERPAVPSPRAELPHLRVSGSVWCRSATGSHLWDVGDGLQLHVGGADDLWRGGVQDLHGHGEQEAGSEGHALPQPVVQVLVLVHQSVMAGGAVHVDPGRAQSGEKAWRRSFQERVR